MTEKKARIRITAGLHLRPAEQLCHMAMQFDSGIKLCFREKEYNAKSLLSLLSACVQQEDEVRIVCSGSDEREAAEAIERFLTKNV